jgi:hypothetical protein
MYSGLFARKVWPKLWNCAKKGKGQRHAMFRRGVVAEVAGLLLLLALMV